MRHRVPPACQNGGPGRAGGSGVAFGGTKSFQEALRILCRRLFSYPGVAGILYRCDTSPTEVCIVARRPMTKPMELLVSAWAEKFWDLYPGVDWKFRVLPSPPDDADTYRCAFWSGG